MMEDSQVREAAKGGGGRVEGPLLEEHSKPRTYASRKRKAKQRVKPKNFLSSKDQLASIGIIAEKRAPIDKEKCRMTTSSIGGKIKRDFSSVLMAGARRQASKNKALTANEIKKKKTKKLKHASFSAPVVSSSSSSNRRTTKQLTQTILDAGQREIASRTCPKCGMLYNIGQEDDEAAHKLFHARYSSGIQFNGWKDENVVETIVLPSSSSPLSSLSSSTSSSSTTGAAATTSVARVLTLNPSHTAKHHRDKALETLEIINNELGGDKKRDFLQLKGGGGTSATLYVYVSKKRIIGALIAKRIKTGYPIRYSNDDDDEKENERYMSATNNNQYDQEHSSKNQEEEGPEEKEEEDQNQASRKKKEAKQGDNDGISANNHHHQEKEQQQPHKSSVLKELQHGRISTPQTSPIAAAAAAAAQSHPKKATSSVKPRLRQVRRRLRSSSSEPLPSSVPNHRHTTTNNRMAGMIMTAGEAAGEQPTSSLEKGGRKRPLIRSSSSTSSGANSLVIDSQCPHDAWLGVDKIWVHKVHRRKGIASSLIEVARRNFIYGLRVPKDKVAFSQPTALGTLFAKNYSKKEDFLVYRQ